MRTTYTSHHCDTPSVGATGFTLALQCTHRETREMTLAELNMAGMNLRAPPDWSDTTNDQRDQVPTLTKRNGVGALQFTVARFVGGEPPKISHDDAEQMLTTYLRSIGIRGPTKAERSVTQNGLLVAKANFQLNREFLRVWLVTDGENSAIATFLFFPRGPAFRDEFHESEQIVSSIQFPKITSQQDK